MDDHEMRVVILNILKEFWEEQPHAALSSDDMLNKIHRLIKKPFNEVVFKRNIKYLQEKGLIDVQWITEGGFIVKINSFGIDYIEHETLFTPIAHIIQYEEEDSQTPDLVPPIRLVTSITSDVLERIRKVDAILPERINEIVDNQVRAREGHEFKSIAYNCRIFLEDFMESIYTDEFTPEDRTTPARSQTKNKIENVIISHKSRSVSLSDLNNGLFIFFSKLIDYINRTAHNDPSNVQQIDSQRCIVYLIFLIDELLRIIEAKE